MTPERWKQIDAVFEQALDLEPEARPEFLKKTCKGDEELRREVELLLKSHAEAEDFLDDRSRFISSESIPKKDETSPVGQVIGRYRIIREIGRGGMGAVYLAERADQQFKQKVAIKLIKRGMDTDAVLERFYNERQILANFDYPNIARLFDGDTTESGLPYFVMEYIEGQPITEYCNQRGLPIAERLKLFRKVCDAVTYAHRQNVIHRDLKPSNIFITAEGEPKLLDFGVAKILQADADAAMMITATGMRVMTPEYASPEQLVGHRVTPASDVYSLGMVLYELLTGRHPYRFEGRSPEQVARVITEQEPTKPSTASAGGSKSSKTRIPNPKLLRGDLDNIVLMALRKEPERRYQSVEELSEDIKRHLEAQPVLARKDTILYRTTKFVRRNPVPVSAASVCLLLTLAVIWLMRERMHEPETSMPEKGIAVLPFQNLSADPQNAYFADGVQEEILTRLSKIADLKVISRASAQRYTSKPNNIREVAKQLGVAHVLEGSVQKADDQVRISVQLINALNDTQLWAQTYDRKVLSSLEVESDVANKIADSLQAKLTEREKADIGAGADTSNPQAYDAYLHALALLNEPGLEPTARLAEYARKAVSVDPSFAKGWALLAGAEAQQYLFPANTTGVQFERARVAAETALRLAPDMPDSHAAMAQFYYFCLQDYDRALNEIEIALHTAPNDCKWRLLDAVIQRRRGDLEAAIRAMQQAAELDPMTPDIWANLGRSYRSNRSFSAAAQFYNRALLINPTDAENVMEQAEVFLAAGDLSRAEQILKPQAFLWPTFAPQCQIAILVYQRRFDEAVRLLEEAGKNEQGDPFYVALAHSLLAKMYWYKGDKAAAEPLLIRSEQELNDVRANGNQTPAIPFWLAQIEARLGRRDHVERELQTLFQSTRKDRWGYPRPEEAAARAYTILGDIDKALPMLEQAISQHTQWGLTPATLKLDPEWDSLRGDPRFEKLVTSFAPKP